jgi:hypothetical protein
MAKKKQLRYIEISQRNMMSRILVGSGASNCNSGPVPCEAFSVTIRRAGSDKCTPQTNYDNCGNVILSANCDQNVAVVKAQEIDASGYAVFVWPATLLNLKEGWYEGHVSNGCDSCGVFPLRIGPRCNVLKVETEILGPDSACWVGCDDACPPGEICPPKTSSGTTFSVYVPTPL